MSIPVHYIEITKQIRNSGDPLTFEGFVFQDFKGMRIKLKMKSYLLLSNIGGNGNICLDKHLIPLLLCNEQEEAICIFPKIEPRVRELEVQLNELLTGLDNVWVNVHGIEDQKKFAIELKKYKTPLESILFRMKKEGTICDGSIDKEFRKSTDLLVKILKSN